MPKERRYDKADPKTTGTLASEKLNSGGSNNKETVALIGAPVVSRRLTSPAANALTHGLTAKKHLPYILGPELLERHRQAFQSEWKPATPTERCLVEELARHAAALERATPIEVAVLRTSARGLTLISEEDNGDGTEHDFILAAACGGEMVDRMTRYRRTHEKGFMNALARLRELRADDRVVPAAARPSVPLRFDEATCVRYLRRRREVGKLHCPACRGNEGLWLANGHRWQCCKCRLQMSVRSGTVMKGSPLALAVWFAAIAAILHDREISTAALCEVTGIRREKTVRKLVERIRLALDSPDAGRLLAGLNRQILEDLAGAC